MQKIINLMKQLGYDITSRGVCAGITQMWEQAYLGNGIKGELEFLGRIERLNREYADKKITKENILQKLEEVSDKVRKKASLTDDDRYLLEMRAMFDGILLYQNPYAAGVEFFIDEKLPAQYDVESISQVAASESLEKKGGIVKVYNAPVVCKRNELQKFFDQLKDQIKDYANDVVITLGSGMHRIGVRYDSAVDKWIVINPGTDMDSRLYRKKLPDGNLPDFQSNAYNQLSCDHAKIASMVISALAFEKNAVLNVSINAPGNLPDLKKISDNFRNIKNQQLQSFNSEMGTINNRGLNIAHLAVVNNHMDYLKKYIELGLDINSKTDDSNLTPLQMASNQNQIEQIKLLVNHGADLKVVDAEGNTPLSSNVKSHNWNNVIAILISIKDFKRVNQEDVVEIKQNIENLREIKNAVIQFADSLANPKEQKDFITHILKNENALGLIFNDKLKKELYKEFNAKTISIQSSIELFDLTTEKMMQKLLGYEVVDVTNDQDQLIARLFFNKNKKIAQLLYYPGVDMDVKDGANKRSLREIINQVDEVRLSEEFRKKFSKYELREHYLIEVADKNSVTPHFVAATSINGKLRVVNPKGHTFVFNRNPDLDYLSEVTDQITQTPLYIGIQDARNENLNPLFVSEVIATTCQVYSGGIRPDEVKKKIKSMSLEEVKKDRPQVLKHGSVISSVSAIQIENEIEKLKSALQGFFQHYTRSVNTKPQSLQGIDFNKDNVWASIERAAKESRTIDPLLKRAYKLVLQLGKQPPAIRLAALLYEVEHYEFLNQAYEYKTKIMPDLLPREKLSYNKNIELLYLNIQNTRKKNDEASIDLTSDNINSGRLTIASEKNEIIHLLGLEINRLKKDDRNLFSMTWRPSDLKVAAYKQVIQAIIQSDPDTPVHKILKNIDNQFLRIEGSIINWKDNDYCENENGIKVKMKDQNNITIHHILTWRRGRIGFFPSTSANKWKEICEKYSPPKSAPSIQGLKIRK